MPPQYVPTEDGVDVVMNPKYHTYRRQDMLLMFWLLSSISESVLTLAVGLNTTSEIWKVLESNFSAQTAARKVQFRIELQYLKKRSMKRNDYIGKMKTCCDALVSAGDINSDMEQALYFLGGVGPRSKLYKLMVEKIQESFSPFY